MLCKLLSSVKRLKGYYSMDSGKTPGPDAFSMGFLKSAWNVVREDFCDVVLHFF